MSTLKSNNENMTINADGASSEIILQQNGTEIGRIGSGFAGTSGQVLTSNGAGAAPTMQDAFPAGTVMIFNQTSAPTGWTKSTTHNDKALRVVSGTAGTGGTASFSSPAHSLSAASHTLTTSQIPSHSHSTTGTGSGTGSLYLQYSNNTAAYNISTAAAGGGQGHSHSLSGSITTPAYVDVIIASKD